MHCIFYTPFWGFTACKRWSKDQIIFKKVLVRSIRTFTISNRVVKMFKCYLFGLSKTFSFYRHATVPLGFPHSGKSFPLYRISPTVTVATRQSINTIYPHNSVNCFFRLTNKKVFFCEAAFARKREAFLRKKYV